jgi:hypothetical protein
MNRGDTTAALDHYTKGVVLAESLGHPVIQTQALTALAAAQTTLNDPAAATTYRRALTQARAVKDAAGEVHAALGLGQVLLQQGSRVEGSQMLQEAAAVARRMGARGGSLARRAEELMAGIGPLEPPPTVTMRPARRREPATAEMERAEPGVEVVDDGTTPAATTQDGSRDAIFRETTLPPL